MGGMGMAVDPSVRARAKVGSLVLAHNLLFVAAQRRAASNRPGDVEMPQKPCAA